jgi:transketolase
MANRNEVVSLELTASRCRENVIRMIRASGHGHIGGALSCLDIVTAVYFHAMNIDPQNPKLEDRDRFILSAGHKCLAQYAVLAEKGYFPKEILDTYGSLHSKIPGHPDMHKLPGVEANTGALGHGLSIACGMALGLRGKNPDAKVYVVMGDGELPEGSNWEAVSVASHYHLDNVVLFVDNNGLQISGKTEDVMNMTPIDARFNAFGWGVKNIDGNNMQEIVATLDSVPFEKGKPNAIIAHTIKCKGLSAGEGNAAFHFWSPLKEEAEAAEKEIKDKTLALEKKKSGEKR